MRSSSPNDLTLSHLSAPGGSFRSATSHSMTALPTTTRHMTPWNNICDEILIPIGSLLAVFLIGAAVIAIS